MSIKTNVWSDHSFQIKIIFLKNILSGILSTCSLQETKLPPINKTAVNFMHIAIVKKEGIWQNSDLRLRAGWEQQYCRRPPFL